MSTAQLSASIVMLMKSWAGLVNRYRSLVPIFHLVCVSPSMQEVGHYFAD